MASYGVKPKYGLVTYATEPKVLIRVSDPKSSEADWVTDQLNQINYAGQKSGKGARFTLGSERSEVSGVSWGGCSETMWWGREDYFLIHGWTAGSLENGVWWEPFGTERGTLLSKKRQWGDNSS